MDTFINFVEGKLTEAQWLDWFEDNKEQVENTCGRTAFLKIKPLSGHSDIANTYKAQKNVHEWLKTKGIVAALSDTYLDAYQKSLKDFSKRQQQKTKIVQNEVEKNFDYLKTLYPKFYNQWIRVCDYSDVLEKGATPTEIKEKEQGLSVIFTKDLTTFLLNISRIECEGISMGIDQLALETFEEKPYLTLGEFWLYGDGDLLLYDLITGQVLCFAHENKPPKVVKIADSITELLEKVFVKHIKL